MVHTSEGMSVFEVILFLFSILFFIIASRCIIIPGWMI